MNGLVGDVGPGVRDHWVRRWNPWVPASAQFSGQDHLTRGRVSLQTPAGQVKFQGLWLKRWLSPPHPGSDGQGSGVVGSDAVARAKIGQERPGKG